MKYSIILPVRNGGLYVKECINSILAQTLQDFNVVVLDNCSTDGTTEWLQSLNDTRIQVYPADKPLDIAGNWARIVSVPKNEFITLIGHDDLLDSNYLAVMDELIQKHPNASLYQAHFRYIDSAGQFTRHCLPMDEVQQGYEFLAHQLTSIMDSTGTGYMMRSKDYDMLGGIPSFPNLIWADYVLWVRLSLESYKATAPAECFSYRLNASTSAKTDGELYQQAFFMYMDFLKELSRNHEQVAAVIQRYGRQYLYKYCEALSHRLLKTKQSNRKTRVSAFIDKCKQLAAELIPGQEFNPSAEFRIRIAAAIDNTAAGRTAFRWVKKILH